MRTFKKSLVAILLVLIQGLCDESLATTEKKNEDQKSNYIVHVAKSEMPDTFERHSSWYESSLKLVSQSAAILYLYDYAIHRFSTRFTPEEARLLERLTGILAVLPEMRSELHTTRTPDFLELDKNADLLPESKAGGEVIVGVLNTGVWLESKSFDDTGLGPIPSS